MSVFPFELDIGLGGGCDGRGGFGFVIYRATSSAAMAPE